MTFQETIESFRAREEEWVENVAPLIESGTLRDGLVAWKSVTIAIKSDGQCQSEAENEMWDWLWEQVQYDQSVFQAVSGVKMQDVGGLLVRLRGLRLIYPDGTINKFARDFLQAQILAKLTGKRPVGRPKKEKLS